MQKKVKYNVFKVCGYNIIAKDNKLGVLGEEKPIGINSKGGIILESQLVSVLEPCSQIYLDESTKKEGKKNG